MAQRTLRSSSGCLVRVLPLLLAAAGVGIASEEPMQLSVVTAADAERAENVLKTSPDDVAIRTGLVKYYFFSQFFPSANETSERRRGHVLWLAGNHPEAPILGRMEGSIERSGAAGGNANDSMALETIWRQETAKPGTAAVVLANAGYFFRLTDREFGAALLQRAAKLDPGNRGHADTLGLLYAEATTGVTSELLESPREVSVEAMRSKFSEQARASLENSRSAVLLRRASRYLTLCQRVGLAAKLGFDPVALSKKLLARAQEIDPIDEKGLSGLANYYGIRAIAHPDLGVKMHLSRKWSEVLQQQAAVVDFLERSRVLSFLARAEYQAADIDAAFDYSGQALVWVRQNRAASENPDAVHRANSILGLVAVDRGDLRAGAQFLIESAKISGSPVLNNFGPGMLLAQALLRKGEREPVLEYFRLCAGFWEMGKERLEEWTKQVRAGEIPEFGVSLNH